MLYRSRADRTAWRRALLAPPAPDAEPPPPVLGHNGGPPLEESDPNLSWRGYVWRKKHKAAWKTPPREIALRRLARAEELGMSYRDYTLEIMERGRYL